MPESQGHDGVPPGNLPHESDDAHDAHDAHEPPKMIEVSVDAPQFQVAAANPERVERGIAVMFFLGLVGFAGFGAAYWQNWSNFWLGVTLSVGFLGLGIGMVGWGKYLMPRGPFSESRHRNEPTAEEREVFLQDLSSRGKVAIERRSFLLTILGAAGAVFGIVAMFPLLRSLGPLPKHLFYTTSWRKGSYLVSPEGRKVHKDDLDKGGVLTVFPEGDVGGALSQTLLIRPESADFGYVVTAPGRETWGPEGYLAFSKVCTHAGCPVALYQKALDELLCPCHQSIFEVGPGRPATPVFGPAPRPLPQLPLYIDSAGYLRAQNHYDEPVGPGFWERDNT
ncbi:MAG: Rieske 2Fe-2S domain-containing protein [Acidimicrobiales bacterium]|jgi:ubiquinol-cytochrome c reductase iron-sulfur subunit